MYLSFGQSLISKGLLDKKTEDRTDIKDGQREGGEAHIESGVRLSSESVRSEAQGVADSGCMAQGSAVHTWNCKKQSDVYELYEDKGSTLLVSNKCIAQRQP